MAILKDLNTKEKKVDPAEEEPLLHGMNTNSSPTANPKKYIFIGVAVLALGILTGFILPKGRGNYSLPGSKGEGLLSSGKKVFGSDDISLFKDVAEGKIEKGGIDGEGTHKLLRPGGESQTVYITSTVLDLNQFNGKKVRVWGQTHAAEKAGWLMDIGRVELLN